MLKRLSLRSKLWTALLPLMLALGAATTILVQSTLDDASREAQTAEFGTLARWVSETVHRLELEGYSSELVLVFEDVERATEARAATDEALTEVKRHIDASGTTDPALNDVLADVRGMLSAARSDLEAGELPRPAVDGRFDGVAHRLLTINELTPTYASDPDFAAELATIGALSNATKTATELRTYVVDDLGQVKSSQELNDLIHDIESGQEDLDRYMLSLKTTASPQFLSRFEELNGPQILQRAKDRSAALSDRYAGTESELGDVYNPSDAWENIESFSGQRDTLAALEVEFTQRLSAEATAAAAESTRRAQTETAITLGVMLLAGFLATTVITRLSNRVKRLTERAQIVATTHLPALVSTLKNSDEEIELPKLEDLDVRGRDELASLAKSFNAVQHALESVAVDQMSVLRKGIADIFVTMSRRNRSLIDRQLALIDELEQGEEDSEVLGKYYRLDHMATRIRRNAESLLVLAGVETQRQFSRPVEVDDVLRAALSEVEDYRRVAILAVEQALVTGAAVADMSHLLSEVLDNATYFSPPDSQVRVAGHFDDNGYLITISDRGPGLSQARLDHYNALLERPPAVGLTLETTLGFYVVARLAKRHDVRVRLVQGSPGLTVHMTIPRRLLQDAPVTPAPATMSNGNGHKPVAAAPTNGQSHSGAPNPIRTETTGDQLPLRTAAIANGPAPRHEAPKPLVPAPTPVQSSAPIIGNPYTTPPMVAPSVGNGASAAEVAYPNGNGHEEAKPKPPAPATTTSAGLPLRDPGTAFVDESPVNTTGPSQRSAQDLKSALGSYQTGARLGRMEPELTQRSTEDTKPAPVSSPPPPAPPPPAPQARKVPNSPASSWWDDPRRDLPTQPTPAKASRPWERDDQEDEGDSYA